MSEGATILVKAGDCKVRVPLSEVEVIMKERPAFIALHEEIGALESKLSELREKRRVEFERITKEHNPNRDYHLFAAAAALLHHGKEVIVRAHRSLVRG